MNHDAMSELKLRIRRAQRTDFSSVLRLLAENGMVVPEVGRSSLRRFRQLVADLGTDFYLAIAEGDAEVIGIVHLTYTRQLTFSPRAMLDQLLVAKQHRAQGIGRQLAEFSISRAQKRGCRTLLCAVPVMEESLGIFLQHLGWKSGSAVLVKQLIPQGGQ